METAFEKLVYESDDKSENGETVKLNKSRVGKRGRGRKLLNQSLPVRRSLRKVKEEPLFYNEAEMIAKVFNEKTEKKLVSKGQPDKPEKVCGANEVDKICGATEVDGQLKLVIKWKNQENPTLIPYDEAKTKYPYAVLDFYEGCMVWETSDNEANNHDD